MSLITPNGISWSVYDVEKPMLGAAISKGYNLGDDFVDSDTGGKTQNYSRLIVPLYCTMILTCASRLPVTWFKDGKWLNDTVSIIIIIRSFLEDHKPHRNE